MSQTGSSLLRAIQNNSMPVLDLFVRESIQNSMDAAGNAKNFVRIDYNIGTFNSVNLAGQLEGITDKLNKRFENEQSYLSVKDTNTVGLTGPLTYDDVVENEYGNLIKLIYEISKPQSKEGAGGSWGLGKTVYFRVGIGLVLYYSRIRSENGKLESRMAACLVEDEKHKDALLKRPGKNIERGIAWWGDKRSNYNNETVPITDENEILKILSIFGISPFKGSDTGTIIIIPYISEDKLTRELSTSDINNDNAIRPFWTTSIESYLRLAVQKWYHPRLNNNLYKYGKYIEVTINGTSICYDDFYPCFKILQDLYNCASHQKEKLRSHPNILASLKTVKLRNVFSTNSDAGTLAHVEVDANLVGMLPPDNMPDPYTFLSLRNPDSSNNPLIMSFTRKTGMVVSYEIMGPWTDNVPKSDNGKYVFAFFVLNSNNTLKVGDKPYVLEEYVRQGELADHTTWGDWTLSSGNPNIVSKIQNHVRKELTKSYRKIEPESVSVEDKGMGREFAKLLLPPTGYGKDSSNPSRRVPSVSGLKKKKNHLEIDPRPVFRDQDMIFKFRLNLTKYDVPVEIFLKAKTEKQDLKADDWEKEDSIDSEFPAKIKALKINTINVGRKELVKTGDTESLKKYLSFEYVKTKRYRQVFGAKIKCNSDEIEGSQVTIVGNIICTSKDPYLKIGIDLEEVI